MKRFFIIILRLLASLFALLFGSALFVIAQQLEKPAYTTPSLQLFIEYMAWNIPLLIILSFISVLVSIISKRLYWGIAVGILGSLFFYIGRKDMYILETSGMGFSALLVEIFVVGSIVLILSKSKRAN